jgi:lipocalin-like protein
MRGIVGVAAIFGMVLLSQGAVGQQKPLTEQIVGTWTLASSHLIRGDGSKTDLFGPNPKGLMIFTGDGRYAIINTRADLPKFASNNRNQGTPDENKAVVQGSIAYFGTYSVDESKKVIKVQIDGSTFPNTVGAPDEQRIVTSITHDEMTVRNPASTTGAIIELNWKRSSNAR